MAQQYPQPNDIPMVRIFNYHPRVSYQIPIVIVNYIIHPDEENEPVFFRVHITTLIVQFTFVLGNLESVDLIHTTHHHEAALM